MCERYMLSGGLKDLSECFDAGFAPGLLFEHDFNVAPSARMPVIREDRKGKRKIELFTWGLIPYWATKEEAAHNTVYARAENLADTSTLRPYFTNRRCLIPAGGFYSWKVEGDRKLPCLVYHTGQSIFAIAGLYSIWESPGGEQVPTFCMITTSTNRKLKVFGDRMPVILEEKDWGQWLNPANRDTDALRDMLIPCSDNVLDFYRVSEEVNYLRHNHPGLIRPFLEEDQ